VDRSIHPACEICGGACCKSFVLWKSLWKDDIANWFALHGVDEGKGVRFPVECSALKDGRCSIYEHRPELCQTSKVGSPMCLDSIGHYVPEKMKVSVIKAAIGEGNGN